jgi:hypothetical protein
MKRHNVLQGLTSCNSSVSGHHMASAEGSRETPAAPLRLASLAEASALVDTSNYLLDIFQLTSDDCNGDTF